jgi:hypothetical protein
MNFLKGFDLYNALLEAVTISEVRPYVLAWEESGGRERYKEWFGDKFRIYLEIQEKSNVQIEVEELLSENGFEIIDYKGNAAVKADAADKTRNHTKISKLVQRFNNELTPKYLQDKDIESENEDFLIVISNHPYDIVGMTTDRKWHSSSCMEIRDGAYKNKVIQDVKKGSLVSYLINREDTNIKNPVGRLLIKPFENRHGNTVLSTDRRVYGMDVNGYRDTVEAWLKQKQGSYKGIYKLKDGLYDDGKSTTGSMNMTDIVSIGEVGGIHCYTFTKKGTEYRGVVSEDGDIIIPAKYKMIGTLSNYFSVYDTENSMCGLIDIKGEIVIPIRYQAIVDGRKYGFDDGFIVKHGKLGLLSNTFEEILPCAYSNLRKGNGAKNHVLVALNHNTEYNIIDINTKKFLLPDSYDYIENFGNGLYKVNRNRQIGLLNSELKEILPCEYDYITTIGKSIIVNKDINGDSLYGAIDIDGNTIVPIEYDDVESDSFFGKFDYLVCTKNRKRGLYDHKGKKLLDCVYDRIVSYGLNHTRILKDGLLGLLDTNFNEVIPTDEYITFDWIGEYIILAKWVDGKRKEAIFDTTQNKIIIPFLFGKIQHGNSRNDMFIVIDDDKLGVYCTKRQQLVVPIEHEGITFENNNTIIVYDKRGESQKIEIK